jgi:hypothetical protein
LGRRLALFPVSLNQHFEDNLGKSLILHSWSGTCEIPFFMCGPPQRKQPPLSVPFPPALIEPVPPNPPLPTVVSWSTKWVYFVLPRLPKFFTCMTCGSKDTSMVDSVASVKSCRLIISSSYNKCYEVIHLYNRGLTHLMESTLMPIFLQKHLFTLGLLLP